MASSPRRSNCQIGALYALAKGPGRLLRAPLAMIEKELRA